MSVLKVILIDETALQCIDRLTLRREDDNAHDRFALLLETDEPVTVGYCPRYLCHLCRDLYRIMATTDVQLSVERLNKDAPVQFRLLCRAFFAQLQVWKFLPMTRIYPVSSTKLLP